MRIGIVGLGYVGLPLAAAFAEVGHEVVGVDTDGRVAEALGAGRSHVEDVPDGVLAGIRERFNATTRYADLAKVDAVVVAVPTPLTRNREPDLQPLIASGTALAGVLREGQLVVLESTTYPGTTRERFAPLLEESGLAAGRDFHLAFSPERIDPGRTDDTLRTTPKIVGALTDECLRRAVELYELVCDEVVTVSGPEEAELTKLLENVFRSVSIALVNELAILCDRMGIDVWEVVDAAATKPYGFMSFKPGPRDGRALPAGRPVLPRLAGARVRHADRVHRARQRGQPAHAVLLRRAHRLGFERPFQARQGLAGGDRGRVVQAGRRRPARVTGAADHAAAARAGGRAQLPRRLHPRAVRLRPAKRVAR
jgi:UDP-N-acetyl-D-glucosamine dehydrogenase